MMVTAMLIVAVLLQCFDGYSTITMLQYGGVFEANPLAAWWMGSVGIVHGTMGLKMLGVAGVCMVAYLCDERRGVKILGVLNAYYLILLGAFNFRYLLRVF